MEKPVFDATDAGVTDNIVSLEKPDTDLSAEEVEELAAEMGIDLPDDEQLAA